jgi:HEAT repeat protein
MGAKVIPLLEEKLESENDDVRREAAEVISMLRKRNQKLDSKKMIFSYIEGLKNENSKLVENANEKLEKLGRTAIFPLTEALKTGNKDVRAYSARILGNIAKSHRLSKKTLEVLVDTLADKNDWVVSNAKKTLEIIGAPLAEILIKRVSKISLCENLLNVSFLEDMLASIGVEIIPRLLKEANSQTVSSFYHFAQSIKKMGIAAIPNLLVALESKNKNVVFGVLCTFSCLEIDLYERATPKLVEFLKNKNEDKIVREWATIALFNKNEIKPTNPELLPILIEILEDKNYEVRSQALRYTINVCNKGFVEIPVQVLINTLKKEKSSENVLLGMKLLVEMQVPPKKILLLLEVCAQKIFQNSFYSSEIISFIVEYASIYGKEKEIAEIFSRNLLKKDSHPNDISVGVLTKLGRVSKDQFSTIVSFLKNKDQRIQMNVIIGLRDIIIKART